MNQYLGALTILVGALLVVLDEKVPDFRKELRGAIVRQHGGDSNLKSKIELACAVIDGLKYAVRN